MKIKCGQCGKKKEPVFFPPKTKEGWVIKTCKKCRSEKQSERRRAWSPLRVKREADNNRVWRGKNKKRLQEKFVEWRIKIKIEVFSHYSKGKPKCKCCGESHLEFLSIDHIKGGGKRHFIGLNRRGAGFYVWLRKNKYPKGFRVLCMNCNFAKGHYKKCPHKIEVIGKVEEKEEEQLP